MKIQRLFIAAIAVALATTAQAQVKIGDNPASITSGTVLDVEKSSRHMVVTDAVNVGIGIINPQNTLHIYNSGTPVLSSAYAKGLTITSDNSNGSPGIYLENTGGPSGERVMKIYNDNTSAFGGVTRFGSTSDDGSTFVRGNILALKHVNGFVGINIATPIAPLHVNSAPVGFTTNATYFFTTNTGLQNAYFNNVAYPTSIVGEGNIVSKTNIIATNGSVFAASDERLKNQIGTSNSYHDLATIMKLRITDYTMIDIVKTGNKKFKKVIAQDVEKVLPEVVSKFTTFLPNVYEQASSVKHLEKDSYSIAVNKATTLKVGDFVKLITEKDGDVDSYVTAVSDKSFTVKSDQAITGKLFVYGVQKDDVRMVDYEAISMLNVSATQALAKKVEALEKENTKLKAVTARVLSSEKAYAQLSKQVQTMQTLLGVNAKASGAKKAVALK